MPNKHVTLRHDGGAAVIIQAHYVQPGELISATRSQEARLVEDHPGVFTRVHPSLETLPTLQVRRVDNTPEAAPLAEDHVDVVPSAEPRPAAEEVEAEPVQPAQAEHSPTFDLLDINSATATDFQGLPGIGPKLAERIVAYRDEHGPFFDVGEIQNVDGISAATFAEMAGRICAVVPDVLETD
jgi:competence ComEA-like helix-hairpin-helix protein